MPPVLTRLWYDTAFPAARTVARDAVPPRLFLGSTRVVFSAVPCYTPQYVHHVVAVVLEKGLHHAIRRSGVLRPALCAFY